MARPRKAALEYRSLDECSAALHELLIVALQLEGLTADRDKAVAAASAEYETAIDSAKSQKQEIETALQTYYMAHAREIEQDGKKSVALYWGTLGRRLNPPALRPLNRNWTWAAILVRLREEFGTRYLRMRDPEVDRDMVKANLSEDELRDCGMKLEQAEEFFAVPDRARQAEV